MAAVEFTGGKTEATLIEMLCDGKELTLQDIEDVWQTSEEM